MHPGDVYKDDFIKITAYEANHDGRRFYFGHDDESISYLIERENKSVFFAGDTALTDNFKNISCDVALMPVGCYNLIDFRICIVRQNRVMKCLK